MSCVPGNHCPILSFTWLVRFIGAMILLYIHGSSYPSFSGLLALLWGLCFLCPNKSQTLGPVTHKRNRIRGAYQQYTSRATKKQKLLGQSRMAFSALSLLVFANPRPQDPDNRIDRIPIRSV